MGHKVREIVDMLTVASHGDRTLDAERAAMWSRRAGQLLEQLHDAQASEACSRERGKAATAEAAAAEAAAARAKTAHDAVAATLSLERRVRERLENELQQAQAGLHEATRAVNKLEECGQLACEAVAQALGCARSDVAEKRAAEAHERAATAEARAANAEARTAKAEARAARAEARAAHAEAHASEVASRAAEAEAQLSAERRLRDESCRRLDAETAAREAAETREEAGRQAAASTRSELGSLIDDLRGKVRALTRALEETKGAAHATGAAACEPACGGANDQSALGAGEGDLSLRRGGAWRRR